MNRHPYPFRMLPIGLALGLLNGCGWLTETQYQRPDMAPPAAWQQESDRPPAVAGESPDLWWKSFGDPALDALIDDVLRRNNDLAAAAWKVRKAWLEAGLTLDKSNPSLSASLSATRNEQLSRISNTGSGNQVMENSGGTVLSSDSSSGSLAISASYEADLWGRLAANSHAARWEALATEQDRQATALSLCGTAAKLYWRAVYLKEKIALDRQEIDYAAKTLTLTQVQRRAGGASALDEAEAQQNLKSQEAALETTLQTEVENANALAILRDGPPQSATLVLGTMPKARLAAVGAGLPVRLLERRPDLRAAEMRLREDLADVDATRTSYLPALTLTGSLGTSSSTLSKIVENPVGTLGAGLTLPFLQWNEMQLSIAASKADYQMAVVNFRQTLYAALADVENALSAGHRTSRRGLILQAALDAAETAERLTKTRHAAGAVSLQTWLDADEKRRVAQEALLENSYDQLTNRVALSWRWAAMRKRRRQIKARRTRLDENRRRARKYRVSSRATISKTFPAMHYLFRD